MINFLFTLILSALFFVLLIAFGAVTFVSRMLFGRKNQSSARQTGPSSSDSFFSKTKRKKIFDKKDGEYVDFEEIK